MSDDNIKKISLNIIDKFFEKNSLVDHHIESCNKFYNEEIKNVFKDLNPLTFSCEYNEEYKKHKYVIDIYIGGKEVDKLYFGKPMTHEKGTNKYLFPNECRLKNLTYSTTIFYDIEIEYKIYNDEKFEELITHTIEMPIKSDEDVNNHFELGSFPIMLKSDLCILNNLDRHVCFNMGECKNDPGGYFIIDGKEKVLVPQEKFGNNIIYIRKLNDNKHDFSVEIKSVSEDSSKPKRTMAIRRNEKTKELFVDIPNVRKPVPLFILLRALGVISDKEICQCILSDIHKNDKYLETLRPSINGASIIFTQLNALHYISTFLKIKSINETFNILTNYLLPHIGECNYKSKALYIGYMVFELLKVIHGERNLTDRDNYAFKRVESSGYLLKDLFTEYCKIMYNNIYITIDKDYYYNKNIYIDEDNISDNKFNIYNLIKDNYFYVKYIENGFKKAFKGNWGEYEHTKKLGVLQDLNRLSYNSFRSHLRKVNLDIDSTSKIVGPHLLHGSQYGLLDPVDTPDGGNVGLHKHMSIMCKFSNYYSITYLIDVILRLTTIYYLENCTYKMIDDKYKLFLNGLWIGMVDISNETDSIYLKNEFIKLRRCGFIPYSISFSLNLLDKQIFIYSDEGRLIRPLYYFIENNKKIKEISYSKLGSLEELKKSNWQQLINGYTFENESFNSIDDFYKDEEHFLKKSSVLEYLDSSELNMCYVSSLYKNLTNSHTHMELHPSLMFGIMGNQVIFPENNQLPRNLFGCGQAKQAVSLYHSNYIHRIDKMGVVLNYGQKPLIRTRYYNYLHNEEHPYGENVIVAIMCHTSYNVEDAILINESAVKRGLFRTTYYNMYETYEEIKNDGKGTNKKINNPNNYDLVLNTKPGYNYNYLDENGIIQENTLMNDKMVVIGKVSVGKEINDESVFPKKGQLGYVDKCFMYNKEGVKIAKVRIREDRKPAIGDKFCSRCGQKGTIGNLIPEEDMPFTKDGLRPDIIVNPHALPSRMTIGQLIETVFAKLSCVTGYPGDSTAFINSGPKHEQIGKHLNHYGYNSQGNEILYNGFTGEQIESKIFMGPTYYMRLKHMVKDKINYRGTGPRSLLTRQTNHGRANDGGLRIGEMERDGVISHGMSYFLKDSMMKRGDEYKMAICNHSGTIAICNKNTNTFYSLLADGPINYDMDDNNLTPSLITKYGKEFSIVDVPYCLKLLMHELTTMNIQMRLITTDNINDLTKKSDINISEFMKNIKESELLPDIEEPISDVKENVNNEVIEDVPNTLDDSLVITNKIEDVPNTLDDSLVITNKIEDVPNTLEDTEKIEDIPNTVEVVKEDAPNTVEVVKEDIPNTVEVVKEDAPNTVEVVKEDTPNTLEVVKEDAPNTVEVVKEDTPNKVEVVKEDSENVVNNINISLPEDFDEES